jgi:hypothetical protein
VERSKVAAGDLAAEYAGDLAQAAVIEAVQAAAP